MTCATLLFLKYPWPGEVKTRLAAGVGARAACSLHRILAETACRRLAPLDPVLCYDPRHPLEAYRRWLGEARWRPQRGGDLGERMHEALAHALCQARSAVLVGTDCPLVDADRIQAAHAQLRDHEVVLGPCLDGGYYLVGARGRVPAGMFDAVDWSTERVLAQTLERLQGRSVALLDRLSDVDTCQDLLRVLPRLDTGLRERLERLLRQVRR